MYQNLKIELAKRDITNRKVAATLNIHENTVAYKLNGDGSFSIEEAFILKDELFPNLDLKYLFKRTVAS